jgi:hypothetical protein
VSFVSFVVNKDVSLPDSQKEVGLIDDLTLIPVQSM